MSGLEWGESMETGDLLVDQQHRNIHRLVDYAEAAKDSPEQLMRVLARLMEHVDIVLKFRCGELTKIGPVVGFLWGWLAEHVHKRDRTFIEFVRAKRMTATLPEPWASNPLKLNGWVG